MTPSSALYSVSAGLCAATIIIASTATDPSQEVKRFIEVDARYSHEKPPYSTQATRDSLDLVQLNASQMLECMQLQNHGIVEEVKKYQHEKSIREQWEVGIAAATLIAFGFAIGTTKW